MTTEPSPRDDYWGVFFAGIRVRDGEDVTVAHNRVEGPWGHTLSFANLLRSVIASNSGSGAQSHGINLRDFTSDLWSFDNTVRNNQIGDMAEYGTFVHNGCRNTFLGNNFQSPGLGAAAVFTETTGANALVGSGRSVIDDGDWDCDGDGQADPNVITGTRRVLSGAKLGPMVGGRGKGSMRMQ